MIATSPACASCLYDQPTGKCAVCGADLCPSCRDEKRPDLHDGCADELPQPDDEPASEECRGGCCGVGPCFYCGGRGFVRL